MSSATTGPNAHGPVPLIIDVSGLLQGSREEIDRIWTALEPWFRTHGYMLYPRTGRPGIVPLNLPEFELSNDPVEYPHACVEDDFISASERAFCTFSSLTAAVNKDKRDVVIKPVCNDNAECAIYQHLMLEPMRSDPMNFTIPILELLKYDDTYSFIVMPRWHGGSTLRENAFDSLKTVFSFTLTMLRNLVFLHNNLIAYRDFRPENILINYYISEGTSEEHRYFFTTGRARFALCDFNLSVMFPPGTPPDKRVCPAAESEWGSSQYHPPDVSDLDTVYDPFAYDVACLGGLLCDLIGYVTPLVPPLAPFLDRMIHPDTMYRYTASEALGAFIAIKDSFTSEYLSQPIPQSLYRDINIRWQRLDRWANLPQAFIDKHLSVQPPVRPRYKLGYYDEAGNIKLEFCEWTVELDSWVFN